jgi:hypothetical protein
MAYDVNAHIVMARISTPPYIPYFPHLHIHSPYSLVLLTLAHHGSWWHYRSVWVYA